MADTMNTWSSIREGANDVERLIGQRQYNLAMVQSRQTLEIMVRALAKKNNIQARDLKTAIDELYETRAISQKTAENYHRIRMIGNKAIHEGDDNPSGANMAYHLLSQELYTFANEFATQSNSVRRTPSGSRPARRPQQSDSGMRPAHRSSKRNNKAKERIFIAVAVVLIIVLAVALLKFFKDKNSKKETETESEMQITMETTAPYVPETFPETEATEPETETPRAYVVTSDVLNVREQPNTDCRILTQLHAGDTVNFVDDYDEEWALIDLDGTEAYVNKNYIILQDLTEEEPAEGEVAEGEAEE